MQKWVSTKIMKKCKTKKVKWNFHEMCSPPFNTVELTLHGMKLFLWNLRWQLIADSLRSHVVPRKTSLKTHQGGLEEQKCWNCKKVHIKLKMLFLDEIGEICIKELMWLFLAQVITMILSLQFKVWFKKQDFSKKGIKIAKRSNKAKRAFSWNMHPS